MGCGASSAGGRELVGDPRFSEPALQGYGGDGGAGLASMYDGTASLLPPKLMIQSAGPELARTSWRLDDPPDGCIFVLEKDSDGKGNFVEQYRGPQENCLVEVDPGSSIRFRVRGIQGTGQTEWSNEVHYVTQAAVPRQPEPPNCSIVNPVDSTTTAAFHVSWTSGRDGGLPIESFDVQMEHDLGHDRYSAGVWTAEAESTRIVYSGPEKSCVVKDELGLLAVSRLRFRVQAKNVMGYSEWSQWSVLGENVDRVCVDEGLCVGEGVVLAQGALLGEDGVTTELDDASKNAEAKLGIAQAPELTNVSPYDVKVSWNAAGVSGGAVQVHYTLEIEDRTAGQGPRDATTSIDTGTARDYVVEGLGAGCSYTFRVRAHHVKDGCQVVGPWSPKATFFTPASVPGQCVELTAKQHAGADHVDLSWDQAPPNGMPISVYAVELSGEGEEFEEVYRGAENRCSVASRKVGQQYRWRVRGVSGMGEGPYSSVAEFTIKACPPPEVTGVVLSNHLADSVDVEWRAVEEGANDVPVTAYVVQLQAAASEGSSRRGSLTAGVSLAQGDEHAGSCSEIVVEAGSPTGSTLSGLEIGKSYVIRVRAQNEAGPGGWSKDIVYTPQAGVPTVISEGIELSSSYQGHVRAEWDAADCNGSNITAYVLEMSIDGTAQGGAAVAEWIEVYRGLDQSFDANDLEVDTRALFRVQAVNVIGGGPWSDVASIEVADYKSMHNIEFTEIVLAEAIGEGAFSVVHKGSWNGKPVAVKRLKVQYVEEQYAEEFRREVELLSLLRHRNIVRYIGASLQAPDLCVLTELCDGSLSDLLYKNNTGKLRPDQILSFAKQIAKGMKYLHNLKPMIIHRDLKSSNLLVDSSMICKISDFGLSRIKNESVTKISGMLGTPGWSAPEIYKQDKYNEKVDMYSYGVVLSEIITGEKPYAGLNQMQIAFATVYQGQRPSLPDSVPKQLRHLIKGCWDGTPAKRPTWDKILDTLVLMDDTPWAHSSRSHGPTEASPVSGHGAGKKTLPKLRSKKLSSSGQGALETPPLAPRQGRLGANRALVVETDEQEGGGGGGGDGAAPGSSRHVADRRGMPQTPQNRNRTRSPSMKSTTPTPGEGRSMRMPGSPERTRGSMRGQSSERSVDDSGHGGGGSIRVRSTYGQRSPSAEVPPNQPSVIGLGLNDTMNSLKAPEPIAQRRTPTALGRSQQTQISPFR